jgi:hypothetical protein
MTGVPITGNVATSPARLRIQLSMSGKAGLARRRQGEHGNFLPSRSSRPCSLREQPLTADENGAVAAALSAGRRAARECARRLSPGRP